MTYVKVRKPTGKIAKPKPGDLLKATNIAFDDGFSHALDEIMHNVAHKDCLPFQKLSGHEISAICYAVESLRKQRKGETK